VLSGITDHLLSIPAWAVLLVTFAVVFAEDALFVGFVLPGETVAVLAGVSASQGHTSLAAVLVVVTAAAVLGDSVGYEVGRHFGPRIIDWHRLAKHRDRLVKAQDLLARRGGWAIMLSRGVAFLRAVMPALAGSARMHYPRFLLWNAIGGVVWSVGVVLIGYYAGQSYKNVESKAGKGVAVVALIVVLLVIVFFRIRRMRTERAERDALEETL
jgi:membrane-associated protein